MKVVLKNAVFESKDFTACLHKREPGNSKEILASQKILCSICKRLQSLLEEAGAELCLLRGFPVVTADVPLPWGGGMCWRGGRSTLARGGPHAGAGGKGTCTPGCWV